MSIDDLLEQGVRSKWYDDDSNDTHSFTIILKSNDTSEPASRYDSWIREIRTAAVAPELKAYVDQAGVRGMQQIEGQVYYNCNSNNDIFHDATQVEDVIEDTYDDNNNVHGKPINSNNDDGNGNNNDTFHDAIQVEDVIDNTYDDNDNLNRKPINNVIDGTDNDDNNNNQKSINNGFLQPVGERKGSTGMMYKHEIAVYLQYSVPDILDHLDSISSIPDLYSNK